MQCTVYLFSRGYVKLMLVVTITNKNKFRSFSLIEKLLHNLSSIFLTVVSPYTSFVAEKSFTKDFPDNNKSSIFMSSSSQSNYQKIVSLATRSLTSL